MYKINENFIKMIYNAMENPPNSIFNAFFKGPLLEKCFIKICFNTIKFQELLVNKTCC